MREVDVVIAHSTSQSQPKCLPASSHAVRHRGPTWGLCQGIKDNSDKRDKILHEFQLRSASNPEMASVSRLYQRRVRIWRLAS